jgi:hypothetical protein
MLDHPIPYLFAPELVTEEHMHMPHPGKPPVGPVPATVLGFDLSSANSYTWQSYISGGIRYPINVVELSKMMYGLRPMFDGGAEHTFDRRSLEEYAGFVSMALLGGSNGEASLPCLLHSFSLTCHSWCPHYPSCWLMANRLVWPIS